MICSSPVSACKIIKLQGFCKIIVNPHYKPFM